MDTEILSLLLKRLGQLEAEIKTIKAALPKPGTTTPDPKPEPTSPYLTADEAADYLRTTRKGLYHLIDKGQLDKPKRKPWRFTKEQLDAYLKGN